MDWILIRFVLLTNQIQLKDFRKGSKNTSQPHNSRLCCQSALRQKNLKTSLLGAALTPHLPGQFAILSHPRSGTLFEHYNCSGGRKPLSLAR